MSFDPSPWADDSGVSPWGADNEDSHVFNGFNDTPYGTASEFTAKVTASDEEHSDDDEGQGQWPSESTPPASAPAVMGHTPTRPRVTPAELLGTPGLAESMPFVSPQGPKSERAAARPSQSPSQHRSRRVVRAARVAVDSDPLMAASEKLEDVALTDPSSPMKAQQISESKSFRQLRAAGLDDWAHASVHEALGRPQTEVFEDAIPGSKLTEGASVKDDIDECEDEIEAQLEGTLKTEIIDIATVGELTGTHTVYTISTTADGVQGYPRNCLVTRRYRDFRWLYKELATSHPGIIIPYPPEKQVVNRFAAQFIEQRRAALASMLEKVTKLPDLRSDRDLIAFLTHDDFTEYQRTRVVSSQSNDASAAAATVGGGLFSSIGSVFATKAEDADPWVVERRAELDALEQILRDLYRALEDLGGQRNELADSLAEFGAVTKALADIGPTPRAGKVLRAFAHVHESLAEHLRLQREQDTLFFNNTVEGQLRVVNSVRDALNSRQSIAAAAAAARAEADKRVQAFERAKRGGNTRVAPDRYSALDQESRVAVTKADLLEKQAEEIARRVNSEYARIEREKISEFRTAVELFLENAIEAQKQAIELWETFYARFCREPEDRRHGHSSQSSQSTHSHN